MKDIKKKTVYVVHCVDTEGPLYESENTPFEQLKNVFGIEVEPTAENLLKLRNKEMDLGGIEDAVAELLDPHRACIGGDWDAVDSMVREVTSEEYRNILLDSAGNGWIFNWCCMAHEGFTGKNPRRRVTGFTAIYDHYRQIVDEQSKGDLIGFHYHPVSLSGNFNDSGTTYVERGNVMSILAHEVIDRAFFPAFYRPGFHTERPDSNWFLEQWIPFDYASQAVKTRGEGQADMADGRFGDWRFAPTEWYPYHPDHDDYQKKGNCRRYITRCLNMYMRSRQMEYQDVAEAFEEARERGASILSFCDHDYKDMRFEIDRVREMIAKAAATYTDVEFRFMDAIEAMRQCLDIPYVEFEMEAHIVSEENRSYLEVTCENGIFGPQPFLAIKLKDGTYHWDNLDFYVPGKIWRYTFDHNTALSEQIEKIGVAANNNCGFTRVILLTNGKINTYDYNKRMK